MKNNKTRKRVLPLLLAMLLLIGAGAYGTRAFFSDQEALNTSIKITTGKIKITAVDTKWMYVPDDNSTIPGYNINSQLVVLEDSVVKTLTLSMNTELGVNIAITNARPGDNFQRAFTVTNDSSLDILIPSVVTVPILSDTSRPTEKLYSVSLIAVGTPDANKNILIPKGTDIVYNMKIEVLSDVTDQTTFNLNQAAEISLDNITITAVQPNKK